jgi:hypothetical protein
VQWCIQICDMNAQQFCDHLVYLQEMTNVDSFIFENPGAKGLMLEAIDEYWDSYFYQEGGIWFYQDNTGKTQVNVEQEDVGEESGEEGEEGGEDIAVGDEGET